MANPEQVKRLKAGVDGWNKWRKKNPEARIDLSGADLSEADLSEANLIETNLSKADLMEANLSKANLSKADLMEANIRFAELNGVTLIRASLIGADLTGVDLSGADFSGADLNEADLRYANLSDTNLDETNLIGADLSETDLSRASLIKASLEGTTFANIDLSKTYGLENVVHVGPSTIGTDSIQRSKGKIPEAFLRGCGLSDWEIESAKLYQPDLSNQEINDIIYKIFDLRARQAVQLSSLFISYSHADAAFVENVEKHLTEMGVRYWRDVHHATAGKLEKQIDHAMRHNPTVLLVLSENSVDSDWVEHEARKARELEKELKRDVLCPVALDDSWKNSNWPKRLMEQIMEYNIVDYSKWEDDQVFDRMFGKMILGLDMFYKK